MRHCFRPLQRYRLPVRATAIVVWLLCGAVSARQPAGYLSPSGDLHATAAAYGLKPGMHVLLVGYYPVRELVDWSDPPMDSNADWTTIDGVQFGDGAGRVNLMAVFNGARLPPRIEGAFWYAAYRADGWLWIEQDGEYAFRIAAADDGGRLGIGGREVVRRLKQGPVHEARVALRHGFHRLRLDGFNIEYGLSLTTEWKPAGASTFAPLPSGLIFRGHALQEGPRLFQVAAVGHVYDYALKVTGDKGPYQFRIVWGSLPQGMALSAQGRLQGKPAAPGFFRFAVAVADPAGQVVEELLGLRVLPAQTHRSRNDAEEFQLSLDDTDPKTLQGGCIAGRGMGGYIAGREQHDGLRTVGGFALFPFHEPALGKTRSINVVDGDGAFGSCRHVSIRGAREYGFHFAGEQPEIFSDYLPAFRKVNRVAVAFRLPPTVVRQGSAGPVSYDYRSDPQAFWAGVAYHVHLAGHNVTRYVGHRKEQWNWHFYHPASHYWGDHWQAANIYYAGNGWWYYETGNQPCGQRSGTHDLAGMYEPLQDTDAGYFESLNRFYHVIDEGWGKTSNTYTDHTFDFDQIRIYREEPGVAVRHSEAEKVARVVIARDRAWVDVPFRVTHRHARPARYWVSKYNGKVPLWDGTGIFLDPKRRGAVAPGDEELGMETPLFRPGETKHFVYRVPTDKMAVGETKIAAVNLRVHDRDDPLSLRGDSIMILIHKADDPAKVHAPSLTTFSKGVVRENKPPVARIDGAATRTARVGEEVRLSGSVSDSDGPEKPLPVWDFGDATELRFGETVAHRYDRAGTYVVRLRASDSILERRASVTIRVETRPLPAARPGDK